MLWDKAFAAQQKSALAELRSAAGSLQAVLLTFLHTRIAGHIRRGDAAETALIELVK